MISYHNDLRNTKNCDAAGDTTLNNQWDFGYPGGGNFYSDYTGVDQFSGARQNEEGADEIGDSIYTIAQNNIDHYPLMKPWHRDFPSGNQPPAANAGKSYQANEGSPITFDASLSSDPDGDPLQYRWDFESDGTWDTQWSNEPVATHNWNDDWNGKATLEVSDGEHPATDTATVTVKNVKPTLNKIVSPIDPIIVNTPIKTSCTFSDVGTADTHCCMGLGRWQFT